MNKQAVIIDGDVLAFRVASVAETRHISALHKSSNTTREFQNRTAFKTFLKDKGIEFNKDDYEITDIQVDLGEELVKSIARDQLQSIRTNLFPDVVEIHLSGKNNFRESLPLPVKYKGNRAETIKPLNLKKCRDFISSLHPTIIANGMESDDTMVISGYKYKKAGFDSILVTNDKDARAYSGLYLYNYTQEEPELKLLPEIGELVKTKSSSGATTVKGDGLKWFAFQWLTGDSTDNYKPTQLCEQSFGDVGAYNLLNDLNKPEDILLSVVKKYREWYPEQFEYTDWEGKKHTATADTMLDLYFKCARMKVTKRDALDYRKFLKSYNLLKVLR